MAERKDKRGEEGLKQVPNLEKAHNHATKILDNDKGGEHESKVNNV